VPKAAADATPAAAVQIDKRHHTLGGHCKHMLLNANSSLPEKAAFNLMIAKTSTRHAEKRKLKTHAK